MTFKANNRGSNHFRKSWDNKTELVREQLDNAHISTNSNRTTGPLRNNSGRRYVLLIIIFKLNICNNLIKLAFFPKDIIAGVVVIIIEIQY